MGKLTSIYVKDEELLKRAQRKAKEVGISLSELFQNCLKQFLESDVTEIFDEKLEKDLTLQRIDAIYGEIKTNTDTIEQLRLLGILYTQIRKAVQRYGKILTEEERQKLQNYMKFIYTKTNSTKISL